MSTPQFGDREPASEQASKAMQCNTSEDTKPEVILRKELWHRGLRYRKNVRELPGNPDIVFWGDKVAVFVDGDFWHGRNWEERRKKLEDGANADYWVPKIKSNIERDKTVNEQLEQKGWHVVRMWGTDVKEAPVRAANRVEEAVGGTG